VRGLEKETKRSGEPECFITSSNDESNAGSYTFNPVSVTSLLNDAIPGWDEDACPSFDF
jgi:hypothetical protein